jgi:cytosine/adenosine deaminase-related metal-dependent hydrolase
LTHSSKNTNSNNLSYRKFQATHLFTGTRLLGPEHVLVTDENGKVEEIIHAEDAGLGIQQLEGVLSPGFVNCHCHLELSHMKGLIPEETGLVDFVLKVVTERHLPDEAIADAINNAENEMRNNGIVAVGDICNNTSTLAQKEKQNLAYYNFIETSGWVPSVAEIRFEKALAFYNEFSPLTPNTKHQTSLSPHAPYSVSEELWRLMMPHFENKTVTIHNQETSFEDSLFEKGDGDFTRMYGMLKMDTSFFKPTGKSSLQSYFPKLRSAKQVLLVHNTFTKEEDVLFVKDQSVNTNWCLCANANLYIEKAVPPVELFRKQNCNIVLGTDSLASNWSLSVLDELKTITKYFPQIPLAEKLQWATSNGARALQVNDTLGSFEKGKTPGVILISHLENENISFESVVRNMF